MNCEQSRNLFDAYLDKSLTGTLATEFGAHQLACSHCRRELALMEVAGHVIATDNEAPLLSDEFTERLVECAADKVKPRTLKFSRTLWFALPAAMAACLTMVVWLGGEDDSSATNLNGEEVKVLGFKDEVESSDEIYENVLKALSLDPTNEELKRKADILRAKSEKIIGDSRKGASLLQDYSKDAIKEIVGSVPNNAAPSVPVQKSDSKDAFESQDESAQGQETGSTDGKRSQPLTEEL